MLSDGVSFPTRTSRRAPTRAHAAARLSRLKKHPEQFRPAPTSAPDSAGSRFQHCLPLQPHGRLVCWMQTQHGVAHPILSIATAAPTVQLSVRRNTSGETTWRAISRLATCVTPNSGVFNRGAVNASSATLLRMSQRSPPGNQPAPWNRKRAGPQIPPGSRAGSGNRLFGPACVEFFFECFSYD
jgi:hypothetical protein